MSSDAEKQFDQQISIEEAVNIVDVIAEHTGFSKSYIKQWMQKGAVWLERGKQIRRMRRASTNLQKGDVLYLYHNPVVLSEEPEPAELIADEGDYSVWFKPAGMLSQGSKWGDHTALYRWAELHLQPQRPSFLVHRLDKATQGLMLIAHKKQAVAALAKLFEQRQIKKKYYAAVKGMPEKKQWTCTEMLDGKSAISHFTVCESSSSKIQTILDVAIETGRKHQIRRHLATSGLPIMGDRLYGDEQGETPLHLISYYLKFQSPFDNQEKCYQLKWAQLGLFSPLFGT